MKSFIIVGFLLATFLQVQGRSIGRNDEMPKVEKVDKVYLPYHPFSCSMKMGPIQVAQIPRVHGIAQLPEDNSALNELWGCIWEKKGIIDEDAVLSEDKLEEYVLDIIAMFEQPGSEELSAAHDIVQECRYVHGIGYGQTAVKIQNCIRRYVAARY